MSRLLAAALVLAVLPAPSLADAALECSLSNESQVDIGNCVAAAEGSVNAALDAALDMAREAAGDLDAASGRAASVPALKAAQAAWAAYRDAQCDFIGTTYGGGSGTGIAIHSCRVELGRARIAELMAEVR